MTADDATVLSVLLHSPWEAELRDAARSDAWGSRTLGALVEQRALAAHVAATCALAQHGAVPEFMEDDISAAFDAVLYERTIRVGTDLSWSLGK